jgi:S-adenosyl-L-methionine hydrolase (adenosine-forming)
MSIITLTTDWQNDDYYLGAVKGYISSASPQVKIVDITHKIEGFKYAHAAFILRNTFFYYPAGTIHLIGVNADVNENQRALCIFIHGQYFIGVGAAMFNALFTDKPERVIELEEKNGLQNSTFPELTLFAKAACLLANGTALSDLGKDITSTYRSSNLMPVFDNNILVGRVVYIDTYSNLITNVTRTVFNETALLRKFVITVKSDIYSLTRISKHYNEVEGGELIALFNSLDLLEIAIRNGRFAEMAGIKIDSPVTIKFR